MDAKTQIIVLLFSYFYGFILYDLFLINNSFKVKGIYKSLIMMLFIYNIVLLYIILVFKINNGNFHIYFFIMMILGFMMSIRFTKKLVNSVKFKQLLEKKKKK